MIKLLLVVMILVVILLAAVVVLSTLYTQSQTKQQRIANGIPAPDEIEEDSRDHKQAVGILRELLTYDDQVMPVFPHAKQREAAQRIVTKFDQS
jgi:hypothetical protein